MWHRIRPPGCAPLPVFLKGRRGLGTLQLIGRCQPFQSTQPPIFGHRNDNSHFAYQPESFYPNADGYQQEADEMRANLNVPDSHSQPRRPGSDLLRCL